MDDTNRAAAVIVALMLVFLALLVVLLAWSAPDQSIERLADFSGYLEDHNDRPAQLLVTFGALIVALLGLIIIIVELMPEQTGSVKVAQIGAGDARISTDDIARRIEKELRSVSRLRGVEARVGSRGARADVKLDLVVDTEADVRQTATEAIERARAIIEGQMGLELDAPPRAEVHFSDDHSDRSAKATLEPARTPSWRPAPSSTPPAPAAGETTDKSEPTHEATSTAHEDRPAGA